MQHMPEPIQAIGDRLAHAQGFVLPTDMDLVPAVFICMFLRRGRSAYRAKDCVLAVSMRTSSSGSLQTCCMRRSLVSCLHFTCVYVRVRVTGSGPTRDMPVFSSVRQGIKQRVDCCHKGNAMCICIIVCNVFGCQARAGCILHHIAYSMLLLFIA
eukprot:152754-Chlamydomonas_euryale.AAC.9